MKIRLLFALAFSLSIVGGAIDAAAQTAFPIKFPTRKAFRNLSKHHFAALPRVKADITLQPRVTEDHGNVSVLHNDGTLVVPENSLDLANSSFVFTPQGDGYTVLAVTPVFVNAGNNTQVARLGGNSVQVN